jgi:hypothetical protein
MKQEVQDKKAEITLNLSVIVQTLLLASTIGFGTSIVSSIDTLTKEVAKLNQSSALQAKDLAYHAVAIKKNAVGIEANKIAINNIINGE